MNDKTKERLAWEEIMKIYEGNAPSEGMLTDFRVAVGGVPMRILNEEQRKQIKDILKKYGLDENHILLERARQVYEAW